MAKDNPGDILTCDWNPVIGCERYSAGCTHCWYLDGVFPWQQRLGNIPKHLSKFESAEFEKRMSYKVLKAKKGIVGVVQHGDLFWDQMPDSRIHKVLDIVDEVAPARPETKYLLWTKRAERMAKVLRERYVRVPSHYGVAVSLEDQAATTRRVPHLIGVEGTKVAVFEPMLGPADIRPFIQELDWVIVGSETSQGARPISLDWVRDLRDATKVAGKPFFVKQLGSSHKHQQRDLDGVEWSEFPNGYVK